MVEKIAELDLELSEGDITQKGYEKKKTKLLAPFLRENQVNNTKPEEQKNENEEHGGRINLAEEVEFN